MTKIERRKTVVTLYQGDYQARLDDLLNRATTAARTEESGGPRRVGQTSEAMRLAKEHDDLLVEAEAAGVPVELSEISHAVYQRLADDHPPRDDDDSDKRQGVNMRTFPGALLAASLPADIDPDELSQLHYRKLESAAWNLHNGDDALPKFSLVSLLKQASDPDSKPLSEQE